MEKSLFVMAFVVFTCCSSTSYSQTLFMKGDAFFHARLTQTDIESIEQNKGAASTILSFAPADSERVLVSTRVGVEEIELIGEDGSVALLPDLYRQIRKRKPRLLREHRDESGAVRLSEVNGIRLLVYNADEDLDGVSLFLRLNEDILCPGSDKPLLYDGYIRTYEAAVTDMLKSPYTEGLSAVFPKDKGYSEVRRSDGSTRFRATMEMSKAKIVLLESEDCDAYFRKEQWYGLYEIAGGRVVHKEFDANGVLQDSTMPK